MTAKRQLMRIKVTPAAKKAVEGWAARQDMTEIGVASRIYEWFDKQPEEIQRAILGLYGPSGPDVAKLILEQMSKQPAEEEPPPVGKAVPRS